MIETASSKTSVEVCPFETFQAQCSRPELIMMTRAEYGRMQFGKCIPKRKNATIGCYKDVREPMHEICSFQEECGLTLPYSTRFKTNCKQFEKQYLFAEYDCIETIDPIENCFVNVDKVKHLTSRYKGQCGTKKYPWMLRVSEGQRIRVKVIPMSVKNQDYCGGIVGSLVEDGATKALVCKSKLLVSDGIDMRNNDRKAAKDSHLVDEFISVSFSLKMILTEWEEEDWRKQNEMFSIAFEVYGCPDIPAKDNRWIKRSENVLTTGCYFTDETWYLTCEENKWIGFFGDCPQFNVTIDYIENEGILVEDTFIAKNGDHGKLMIFSKVIMSFVLIVCSLIICLATICCAFICFKRTTTSDWKTKDIQLPVAEPNKEVLDSQPTTIYPDIREDVAEIKNQDKGNETREVENEIDK